MLSDLVSSTNNTILNNNTNATNFMKKASKSTKSGLSALEKNLNSAHGNCKKHNTQFNAKVEVILEIYSFFYINFYNFFGEMFLFLSQNLNYLHVSIIDLKIKLNIYVFM